MSLKDRISEDMKSALRARETARLSALRLLLAAVKQREVDERKTLSDAEVDRGDREDAQATARLDRAV